MCDNLISIVISATALIVSIFVYLNQRYSFKRERFESKLFDMINFHRDNVKEFEIKDHIQGKKIFISLMKEFKCALSIVDPKYKLHDRFIISYLILFYGVDEESNAALDDMLSIYIKNKKERINLYGSLLEKKRKTKKECKSLFNRDKYKYIYFDGHQTRLGHYYRHLYQTFSFIEENTSSFIFGDSAEDEKIRYAKIVRTQLSTYEQALLFINSLTPLGINWWKEDYIIKYKLVKNVPSNFFKENEINFKSYFPDKYLEQDQFNGKEYKFFNGEITKMKTN